MAHLVRHGAVALAVALTGPVLPVAAAAHTESGSRPMSGTDVLPRVAYSLVQESDGNRPRSGSEVFLLFGAGDLAFIYASNASRAVADQATYSYSDGRLSLQLSTPDLKVSTTFSLDLSALKVSMPFQIFSSKSGTSLWQRQTLGLDQGMLAIYNAAKAAGTSSQMAAANQAFSYGRAWAASEGPGAPALADLGDDVVVTYPGSPPVAVSLYSSAPSCSVTSCSSLSTSGFASLPGISSGPSVHPDSQFDPRKRTAVLIAPFPALAGPGLLKALSATLSQRGYKVTSLVGAQASVAAITTSLASSPGYVLFSSHGDSGGMLTTGQSIATQGALDPDKVAASYSELKSQLATDGLGGLANYKTGGSMPFMLAEPNCSLRVAGPPARASCSWQVLLAPAFWEWMKSKRKAGFSHSLVFIGASETDVTSRLRDTIAARAYFAFNGDVAANLASAVERYVAQSLWRPTHSAEEAFYDLLRTGETHQIIYKEDQLLQRVLGPRGSGATLDALDGWGWDGTTMVSYRKNGWLSTNVSPAQIWWMLYSARLSRQTSVGASRLDSCYVRYWSHGNPGGVANPYCNSATIGIPKNPTSLKIDVAYAIYLLDGARPPGFPMGHLPPRFTLAD